MRQFIEITIKIIILGLLARTWVVSGLVIPLIVQSDSMAERFRGPHVRHVCPSCQFPFSCSLRATDGFQSGDQHVYCALCGHAARYSAELQAHSGDRLVIDRNVFNWRRPRHWELAVFRNPSDPREVCLKRIIGLPRETVSLRDGQVYIDGQIARKSLRQFASLAILVDDSRYLAKFRQQATRWHAQRPDSAWRTKRDKFLLPAADPVRPAEPAEIDWLVFSPARPDFLGDAAIEGPIRGHIGYNQDASAWSRPIDEILLRCRLSAVGSGQLWLRLTAGGVPIRVCFDLHAGQIELFREQRLLAKQSFDPQVLSSGTLIELGHVDQQILLALAGKSLLTHPLTSTSNAAALKTNNLAIGSPNLQLQVEHIEVWRDIYHHPTSISRLPTPRPIRPDAPDGSREDSSLRSVDVASPYLLEEDEYFALGDNSAVSVDSRSWAPNYRLKHGLLLGTPVRVW